MQRKPDDKYTLTNDKVHMRIYIHSNSGQNRTTRVTVTLPLLSDVNQMFILRKPKFC